MSTFRDPILRKHYSNHPDDSHLEVVLHQNFKGEWVTHVLNKQSGGFGHGHYHGKNLQEAVRDFNGRGTETLFTLGEVMLLIEKHELLDVIKYQAFALETAANFLAGRMPDSSEELRKYADLGKAALDKHRTEPL